MYSAGPPSPSILPACAPSFDAWRHAARALLAYGVPPGRVCWTAEGAPFSGAPASGRARHHSSTVLTESQAGARLPGALLVLLQRASCCRVPYRWDLLYRTVWRWQRGAAVAHDGADPDLRRLRAMARAVRDEEHAMRHKIRFHERPANAGAPRFVAWCEPAHDVLPQLAAHFVRRMGGVSWMIATPEASVLWDGARLRNCGPLVGGADELHGDGMAPWLACYRSVFAGAAPPVLAHAGRARRIIALAPAGAGSAGGAPPGPANPTENPATLDQCRRCGLWRHATQAVGGAGSKRARIMLVGEQPGDQEDIAGAPFVGPAGKLLDRVCEQAGVDRRALYLTNAVKHFKWEPRGKRRLHKTPVQREIDACGYWLDRELAQVRPDVIVALGTTALKAVLGTSHVTLKDTLGQALRHEGRWVVTVYHPSYVLRVPDEAARKQAFAVLVDGLRLARSLLDRPAGA